MTAKEPPLSFSVGQKLGPYTLVRPLGAGAFGVVYEARKAPLGKPVALKLLRHEKADGSEDAARFLQEAKAAASLRHPHIVDVDDVGKIDGFPYIAMEYLEGESLTACLKREGQLSVEMTLDLLFPVFSAVSAVHSKGIVHRDLKPDNIYLWKPVSGHTHPKLLDFGIAKVRESDEAVELTRSGVCLGTPSYMSPEQWGSSKHATDKCDQWALAVIAYRCVTGRLPFESSDLRSMVLSIVTDPPTPIASYSSTVPAGFERVLFNALEKSPEKRFRSVREFARSLLPFANSAARFRWSAEFGEAIVLDPLPEAIAPIAEPLAPPIREPISDSLNASTKVIPTSRVPRHMISQRTLAGVIFVLVTAGLFLGRWLGHTYGNPLPQQSAGSPLASRPVMGAAMGIQPASSLSPSQAVAPSGVIVPHAPEDGGLERAAPHGHRHHLSSHHDSRNENSQAPSTSAPMATGIAAPNI